MQNYKMTISYDGRRYKGFKSSKGNEDKTIQGKLELILKKLYEQKVEIIGAINTEPGVSAKMQVVNFKSPNNKHDDTAILEYFEKYLPDDIVIVSVEKTNDRFHSRLLVKSIKYEYVLWKINAHHRPVFNRFFVNRMEKEINTSKMKEAAEIFIGKHDFAAYSTKCKPDSSIKEVFEINITECDNQINISISANGFLLNMERHIIGTLIQIGLNERKIETIEKSFKSKDSKDVGHKPMAYALCLVDVKY